MLRLIQRKGTKTEEIAGLQACGTAGETISLSFELTSDEPIPEFRLRILESSPTNVDIKIDIFVVKTWQVAGVGIYQSDSMLVGELLLKDDRIDLRDGYRRKVTNWRSIFNPAWFYKGPQIPVHEDVRTTLHRQAKVFLLRINIAAFAKPDIYETQLKCISDGNDVLSIPIKIDVRPVALLSPPTDFFIWYKGRLDRSCPQHYVSEELFRAQLHDIIDHGFNCISIGELDTELAQKAIEIAEKVGFKKIVIVPPFPELQKLKFRAAQPVIYLSDELDMHVEFPNKEKPEDLIKYHQINWTRAQTLNLSTTMASLLSHTFIKRFQTAADIGHAPEIISLYLNRNREYLQFIDQLKDIPKRKIYFYWQCYMEKPSLNRVLAGAYLWKTGAAGISPYCYQHMPVYPNSPFNDFDQWEPDFHEGGIDRPFKDHMTTYPARNGIIPTLQWEALRDGITDFKYWYTLNYWITKGLASSTRAAVDLATAAKQRSNALLSRIDILAIAINSETEQEPYADIEPHEYDEMRNQLRDDIQALATILSTEEKH